MPEPIRTQEQFRAAIKESVADLAKSDPQIFVDALASDTGALRESLRKAGMIVSEGVKVDPKTVTDAREEAVEQGRIFNAFGGRQMEACRHMARRVRKADGNMGLTFLGDPETYQAAEAWMRALLSGGRDPVTKEHLLELAEKCNRGVRAPGTPLNTDVGLAGGVLVPSPVVAEIFVNFQERFVLGSMVQVYVSAAPLRFPRRISLVTLSRSSQGGTTDIAEVDYTQTLGTVTLSANKVSAIAYIDPLLVQAAVIGPVQYVIGQFAEAMAKDTQRVIVAGQRASLEPLGINNLPTAGGNAYDRAFLGTWTDTDNKTRRNSIRQAWYFVSQLHRESPKFIWITNNDGVQKMASLNDVDQQPFKDAANGSAPTYMGKQVVESTAITTNTTTTILGGDMGQYAWVEAPGGLRVEQTTEGGAAWTSDTIGIKMVQLVDGAPIIPPAFVNLPSVVVP